VTGGTPQNVKIRTYKWGKRGRSALKNSFAGDADYDLIEHKVDYPEGGGYSTLTSLELFHPLHRTSIKYMVRASILGHGQTRHNGKEKKRESSNSKEFKDSLQ